MRIEATVLAAALAMIATPGQARTLKALFSDDANALVAIDVETLKREGGLVAVDAYFVLPAPMPKPVGDKTVLVENYIIRLQYDCAARMVRSQGDTMEDLTASYPGDIGVHDWTVVDAGSPSDAILAAVCVEPPKLPSETFATVADLAGPYRQSVAAHKQAAAPAPEQN